ncbi:hypothetical protein [Aquamicrobium soli]|uniref:Uncharacterized protein n=1 Tax=Aquamicrobium soli TaxID=1811518 RepID=A0ABV7KGI8_9HYPH
MNYRDWHVGMKVVFVGSEGFLVAGRSARLEIGHVYTIADLHMSSIGDEVRGGGGERYILSEDALYISFGQKIWYHAGAFRPVEPRKTDISIFQQLLSPSKIKARADA